MKPERLSATIVTFLPDAALLERALASLGAAIANARVSGLVGEASVFIVDNSVPAEVAAIEAASRAFPREAGSLRIVHGHGNVGYGRANNLVLGDLDSEVHLVMNPDVELAPDAIAAAVRALRADATIGAIAPAVRGPAGERQYLCKRYPSVWVLFLRGFAPAFVRERFAAALDRYEMRDIAPERAFAPVPLASGCFMIVRTAIFRRLRGFDPRFFMYFEDYDLSLRIGREAVVAYVPEARIVHHGGDASRKGWRHVAWFMRSAWRFFATHGWKIA